jgi:glycosyltransferase involved in cell wall biosynthesis
MTRRIVHMHFGKEGGAERFFVNLVEAFAERGIEQRFVIRPGRSFDATLARLGPVMRSNYRRLSLGRPITTWRVHRMMRRWQPDVAMAWMSRSSALLPSHGSAFRVTRLGDYPRHLKNFRNNDALISNVPGIAEKARRLGWDRGLHVISNFPREVTPVAIDRASLDTPEDAFVICGTGRFVGRKGFPTLIRAAAQVPGAWLWLAGEGEDRYALEALVDELGLRDRTRFTGWIDEPMHVVAAADCYVMPSRHEPLGNVILEAWHAGTPPVSTRSEGPSWFVADGEDALMVDIDAVDQMAAAIQRLRDDPALGQRLVTAGRAKLAARFTKDRIVDEYLALFDGHRR